MTTPTPMTKEEVRQAEIEALEMHRHGLLMQVAALEKQLALLGRVFKRNEEKPRPG